MPMSEAKKKANKKWNEKSYKETYDRVLVLLKKGKKDIIKAAAVANGESTNAYINRAIDMLLEADQRNVLRTEVDRQDVLIPEVTEEQLGDLSMLYGDNNG